MHCLFISLDDYKIIDGTNKELAREMHFVLAHTKTLHLQSHIVSDS
jgi:hypothetical protein